MPRAKSVSDQQTTYMPNTNYSPSYNPTNAYSFTSFVGFINNNFAFLLLAIILLVGGFFAGSLWTENQLLKKGGLAAAPTAADPGAPAGPTADQLKNAPEVTDADYIRGDENAKVTLIEYSDFECPFCANFHPTMTQVMDEYEGKVRWVYRHFPLSFHPNAQKAAEASECVGKQLGTDGFWSFADKMFAENTKLGGRLNPDTYTTVAATVAGLDQAAFKKCVDSGEMAAVVKEKNDGGAAAGISGTPGTIIMTEDGQAELIPGALPFADVKTMLDKYVQ